MNKLNTKATLRWPIAQSPSVPDDVRLRFLDRYRNRITSEGQLLLSCQRYREAGKNASDCLARLRQMLSAVAQPPKIRKRTKPTRASAGRRLDDKRRQGKKKQLRRQVPE